YALLGLCGKARDGHHAKAKKYDADDCPQPHERPSRSGAPIRKFGITLRQTRLRTWESRRTSKHMILVRLLDLKFLLEMAGPLQIRRTGRSSSRALNSVIRRP